MKPKDIPHPKFEHAKSLTLLELNGLKIDNKHTLLTPQILERVASQSKAPSKTPTKAGSKA